MIKNLLLNKSFSLKTYLGKDPKCYSNGYIRPSMGISDKTYGFTSGMPSKVFHYLSLIFQLPAYLHLL